MYSFITGSVRADHDAPVPTTVYRMRLSAFFHDLDRSSWVPISGSVLRLLQGKIHHDTNKEIASKRLFEWRLHASAGQPAPQAKTKRHLVIRHNLQQGVQQLLQQWHQQWLRREQQYGEETCLKRLHPMFADAKFARFDSKQLIRTNQITPIERSLPTPTATIL